MSAKDGIPRPESKSDDDSAILFVRGMPRDLPAKLKGAAAFQQKTLGSTSKKCVLIIFRNIQELERKGILPKQK